MRNGVSHAAHASDPSAVPVGAVPCGVRDAILIAEEAMVETLDVGGFGAVAGAATAAGAERNAFGAVLERRVPADPVTRVRRAAEAVAAGRRVGLVAAVDDLLAARHVLRAMAEQRLGTVVHALETDGGSRALALADLGWGLLFAGDVEESRDLSLVARRAAEDSGAPFFVVHDLTGGRRVEPLPPLDPALVEAFVGPPGLHIRTAADPAHPVHAQVDARAFGERVPFALASALRDLESLTGRRRDVVTRSPDSEGAALQLVGLGAVGDALLGDGAGLLALGFDLSATKVTAFRPFAGARLVRLLARAQAVTVIEPIDEPLAQSNPLTRELKAAFADALTWAPGYPGVGRIPRVVAGAVGRSQELSGRLLEAIVRNMADGDHGKRAFVVGGDVSHALPLPPLPAAAPSVASSHAFHMRGIVREAALAGLASDLACSILAEVLALKVRATVFAVPLADGGGHAFDLVAATARPLGSHAASPLSLVVLEDVAALLSGNPIARLGRGGTLAVPARRPGAESLWSDLPPYAKAIAFDREVEVLGWEAGGPTGGSADVTACAVAAAFVGVALAALAQPVNGRAVVDPSLVERKAAEAVLARGEAAQVAERAGGAARRAFDAAIVVPRALVAGDEGSVILGRKDARAGAGV